ncbi:MAG: hypothetical protein WBY01_00875 [Pseudolabrys sp.]|jgi:hypothetical protein
MRHKLDQIEGNEHGSAAISLPSDWIEHGEPIAVSDYRFTIDQKMSVRAAPTLPPRQEEIEM